MAIAAWWSHHGKLRSNIPRNFSAQNSLIIFYLTSRVFHLADKLKNEWSIVLTRE